MIFPEIKKLYKYMPFNTNTMTALVNEKFWFSRPENFNDPLDCGLRLLSIMSKEAFIVSVEEYLKLAKEKKDQKAINAFKRMLANIKKEPSTGNELINYLAETRSSRYAKEIKKIGILSLSEVCDNILMWSHYAEQHKGLCIEFDRIEGNDLATNEKTLPVRYSIKKPEIAVNELILGDDGLKKEIRRSLIYTKSNDWAYEREWRTVVDSGNKIESINAKLTTIIFGFKMPNAQRLTIFNILKNNHDIKFKEAILKSDNFGLDIVEVDPSTYEDEQQGESNATITSPQRPAKATKASISTKTKPIPKKATNSNHPIPIFKNSKRA